MWIEREPESRLGPTMRREGRSLRVVVVEEAEEVATEAVGSCWRRWCCPLRIAWRCFALLIRS